MAKDKVKSDPIALMTASQINDSITATIAEITRIMQTKDLDDKLKIELLTVHKDHLDYLRGIAKDLTRNKPTTWDGIAMEMFTKK